jgi:hypothetical protein
MAVEQLKARTAVVEGRRVVVLETSRARVRDAMVSGAMAMHGIDVAGSIGEMAVDGYVFELASSKRPQIWTSSSDVLS